MLQQTLSRGFDAVEDLLIFEPALRRYFRRRVGASEIDDLIQEVYLSLQTRRADSPVEDLQRYLFTVAGHAIIRKRNREKSWLFDSREEVEAQEEISPERILLARERLDRAISVIDGLPPRTREAFVLHRFQDMTYQRIAQMLGISVSGVEKHIMNALRVLLAARETGG